MQTAEINNHNQWVTRIFLFGTPVVAIALTTWYVYTTPFQPLIWIFGLIYYYLSGMSITGGYHRLFSHRAYDASKTVKWMYSLFGAAAFQHSILKWSLDHRLHHRHVDTDADPYSIKKGFWYAHIGWMLNEQSYPPNADVFTRDLEKDPIVHFQHRHYVLIATFMSFIFPMLVGWCLGSALGGLAVGGFLRLVVLHHATFLINSSAHTFGRKNFTEDHSGKDNALMAFFTFGEGYHNFHHTFANDYRNGIRWYQWDPTKWAIQIFASFGLARNLRATSEDEILAARLTMDENKLRQNWKHQVAAFEDHMLQLREKVARAQANWSNLKKEYRALKKSYTDASRARLEALRAEIKIAQQEFRHYWAEWRAYHTYLLIAARATA